MDEWWVVEGVKKGVGFVAPHRGISGIGGGKGFSALLEECKYVLPSPFFVNRGAENVPPHAEPRRGRIRY